MGVLKNQRHELFAQALAKGATADAAYAEAGYSPNRGNATRLNANESVRKRVEEIKAAAARKTVNAIALTEADFLSRLIREADYMDEGASHSARVSAVKIIGEHLGLLKNRMEHDVSDALAELIAQSQGSALPLGSQRDDGK
jgi:hypothetical protein